MEISELNPHIRYARIHQWHLHSGKEFSICYDCRIFFFENTGGSITANGIKYDISNSTAIYLPPLSKYRFDLLNSKNTQIIILDFDLVNDYSDLKSSIGTATESNFNPDKVLNYPIPELLSQPIVKQMPQIRQALMQCTDNFLQMNSFYRESSSALLKLCLIEFIRRNDKNSAYSKLCEQVLAYIHENYAVHTLTNTDIANKFSYHPYYLSCIIKQETGKSLHQYLIDYRLRIAKNYLLTTQHDIEQIAWESGFSSTAYFIKLFREHTGVTPQKYRKFRFHTEL